MGVSPMFLGGKTRARRPCHIGMNPLLLGRPSIRALPTMTAYIALGANLGDREKTLRAALAALGATPEVKLGAVAGSLENPAVGGPADSPDFLNTVAEVETTLSPKALLHRLLEIERSLGRERTEKWGPRT